MIWNGIFEEFIFYDIGECRNGNAKHKSFMITFLILFFQLGIKFNFWSRKGAPARVVFHILLVTRHGANLK